MTEDTHADVSTNTMPHRLRKMAGRNPEEHHRASTPLELLYDLTLVVAFGVAGSQLAHVLATGHIAVALAGFPFAIFSAVWAWVGFSWFASAYDTDDWFMRLAVLVQMAGVTMLALGIPDLYHGMEDGWQIHNTVLVIGYIVMRVAFVALWLRAANDDPLRKRTCLTYAIGISVAQVGWAITAFAHLSTPVTILIITALVIFEFFIPYMAEGKESGTPWHPHHIAERYGLMIIISLGEGIIGTTSALEALIAAQGWTLQAVVVLAAGLSLTFGCWWIYFSVPFGEILAKNREKGFIFGYGHIFLYMAIAAIGAGLHVAAYFFQGKTVLSPVGALLAVAIPVAVYIYGCYLIIPAMRMVAVTKAHRKILIASTAVLVLAVVLVSLGLTLGWGLMIVMLAPWTSVLGYNVLWYRTKKVKPSTTTSA